MSDTALQTTEPHRLFPECTGMATGMTALLDAFHKADLSGDHEEAARLLNAVTEITARARDLCVEAIEAEDKGNDTKAFGLWKEVADTAEGPIGARGCAEVGNAYLSGDGVAQNTTDGIRYLGAAMACGSAEAHRYMGNAYSSGAGIARDEAEAFRHYGIAAKLGDGAAHFNLGMAYWSGRGAGKDYAAGLSHFRTAAKDEDETVRQLAQEAIGLAYERGLSVKQDFSKALDLYEAAWESGSVSAKESYTHLKRQEFRARGFAFPYWQLALAIVSVVALAFLWSRLLPGQRLSAIAVPPAFLLLAVYRLAPRLGDRRKRKIEKQFNTTLSDGALSQKIGGVRWAIVDGQFFHVVHRTDRGNLYDAKTSREARAGGELGALAARRGVAAACIIALCALAGLSYIAVLPFAALASLLILIVLAVLTLWEIAFRRGYQLIPGAMALDPDPLKAQRAEVEKQQIHGDARLSTEAEVTTTASHSGKSRLQDQEF